MSTRSTRKRRRSQAFPDVEEAHEKHVAVHDGAPAYVESTGQDRLDKEADVWEEVKSEHYEAFDLSSSLPRRFDLVRELDQQDAKTTVSLLDNLMKYVQIRRTIASSARQAAEADPPNNPDSTQDSPDSSAEGSTASNDRSMPPPNGASSSSTYHASVAQSMPPSTREMLVLIAKLSEASIRDRVEKKHLMRSAGDSVKRNIRLIDQAIQKQEHLISLGARPGTHLAPIILPEIVMPRLDKPSRESTRSPNLDEAFGGEDHPPKQRRKKGRRKKKEASSGEAAAPLPRPKPPVIPNPDPNEERYCYCDQVSFGEVPIHLIAFCNMLTGDKMIACDDPHCKREWFHLTCTNLPAAPEGRKKWYCDDCTQRKNRKRNR
ncbi:hypothetical protein DFH07DRAFT_116772 [Mycena maculata]|uniref:PHD-type domain-containing protein n=1 Tax=Mycena maculata TaxID=230809 RepID=A0AAD7I5X5_9AGAR|nr:hypothetical protein DFH07DRAFT_116772 [Mycena maculata]